MSLALIKQIDEAIDELVEATERALEDGRVTDHDRILMRAHIAEYLDGELPRASHYEKLRRVLDRLDGKAAGLQ